MHILGICLNFTGLVLLLNYWTRNDELEAATMPQNLHVQIITKAGDIASYSKTHVLLSSCICPVYSRYIPGIYMSYSLICFFAGLLGLPSAPGGFRPGLSAGPLCFCDRKPCKPRLGPTKVPQPVVDLINMAVPAWCRALTVCTRECQGLLLSCSVLVLVRNGSGGVVIKEARKEWHLPKEVLHSATIQSRDRWGFTQQPNSIWLHHASGLQAKILKSAKENHVKRNVFRTTVVVTMFACIDGTQSTFEEELWAYNPHAIWVRNGWCNVVISTTITYVVRIGGLWPDSPVNNIPNICHVYTCNMSEIELMNTKHILVQCIWHNEKQTFLFIEIISKAGNLRRGMAGIEPTPSKSSLFALPTKPRGRYIA